MTNNLYRIETTGTIENPKMNGSAMLYCDSGIAFVKLHPVRINAKPKIDCNNVPHGRWVYDHWCEFKCSICGEFSNSKPYKGRENYCPNCGAKMDGDGNGT